MTTQGISTAKTDYFSIMFSFNSDYVSLATKCPTNYPYVSNFGQSCTKYPQTLFDKTSTSSSISCPGSICRTRTRGGLKHGTYLTGDMDRFLGILKPCFRFDDFTSGFPPCCRLHDALDPRNDLTGYADCSSAIFLLL